MMEPESTAKPAGLTGTARVAADPTSDARAEQRTPAPQKRRPRRRPGRPPGEGTSRDAILQAARQEFAKLGYDRTTIRSIAASAGVDPRMVTHYFRTKQHLFLEVVEPPIDPAAAFPSAQGDLTPTEIGLAVTRYLVRSLEADEARNLVLALLRSASSEPDVVPLVRSFVTERILAPVASQVTADRPDLRAALIGSQVVGLVNARYLVGIDALAEVDSDTLISAIAPVITHYLTGDLD